MFVMLIFVAKEDSDECRIQLQVVVIFCKLKQNQL